MNSSLPPTHADLEVRITPLGTAWGLWLHLTNPDVHHGPFPVHLDIAHLRTVAWDPEAYGTDLFTMLFADPQAYTAFRNCCTASLAAGRHVRLRIMVPPDLQGLRWELLYDPSSSCFIALSDTFIPTRYLSGDDYAPLSLRSQSDLRALLLVAAPRNGEQYGLSPIDAAHEARQTRSALGTIPTDILGTDGAPPATWANLEQELQKGYDILGIIAHGQLQAGEPWLWLVTAQGDAARCRGQDLAQLMRRLGDRRPRLVLLASCASAGEGFSDTAAALGPALAQAGVVAVIAMQGPITMAASQRFTTRFFQELQRDGMVERALHAGRSALYPDYPQDWYLPVLYSRLPEGRLWTGTVRFNALVRPLIEHYTAVFGGRDAELAELDTFLHDPLHPFGLLVAPTGLGKTALLVHWIARVQQYYPQWRTIFAPISIRFQTAGEDAALRLLAQQLAELHNDLGQFRSYDQSPFGLRALITDYLRRPLPPGVSALVVIDGVDEATGWKLGPLCAVPPQPGLKIVVSARQRATMQREDWCHEVGWEPAAVANLDLQRLERRAVAALLQQCDLLYASDPTFVDTFYRVSEGDPLTSNLLIKALQGGVIMPDTLTRRPPGIEAFLKDWVETLRERRQASQPIRELLALCAAAYGPLTSDDLQALAPHVFQEQSDIVDTVHDDEVARFIIKVGEAQHTYVFSHQRLREVKKTSTFRYPLQKRWAAGDDMVKVW